MVIQLKRASLALCAIGTMLAASAAMSAPAAKSSGADSEYQREVARCTSGQSNQDRATCLKEAGAARDEARRGGLTAAPATQYQQNALARCAALPAADQEACKARMQGMGTTQGSVEAGGVYREYRETVPASPAGPRP